MWRRIDVKKDERALVFCDGELVEVLAEGTAWRLDPWRELDVAVVSTRDPWLVRADLAVIAKSSARPYDLLVLDLDETERALVWIDDDFAAALRPGVYGLWTSSRYVRVEVLDA